MADSVQYALDRMVADLEDLRQRKIFSQAEVRAIIAKRREFEYLLRRRESRRQDFVRYAEHELRVESLRALRAKRLEGARQKTKKKKGASSDGRAAAGVGAASDYSCVRLVRSILNRAVAKFPGDVDLWLQYIGFAARQGQTKTLGRLFARALQLHPRNAGLWIKAASWEFFDAGNSSSARSLMQRGLRINPGTRSLWLQYFRLEFCYVEKLAGRRDVLGLDDDIGVVGTEDGGGEHEAMIIPPLEAEAEGAGTGDRAGAPSFKAVTKATAEDATTPVMNDTARRFYRGAVPLAVFRAAIKAVPHDVGFRGEFLHCCTTDFPGLGDEVARAILRSIARDFPKSCEAWELRAVYPLLIAGGGGSDIGSSDKEESSKQSKVLATAFQESIDVFELAIEAVGSREADMWVRYAAFLRERLEAVDQGGGVGKRGEVTRGSAVAEQLAVLMKQVLTRAVEKHVASGKSLPGSVGASPPFSEVFAKEVGGNVDEAERRTGDAQEALSAGLADICLALGETEEALEALRAATKYLPGRPGPWLRRASLERRLDSLELSTGMMSSIGDPVESVIERSRPKKKRSRTAGGSRSGSGGSSAIQTLREGLSAVPANDPGYPNLWRELLSSLVAAGAGKTDEATAFRQAVMACDPSGADPGNAQGEFLEGYLRWSGAVGGSGAARAAFEWARRSFLLAGTGAIGAYEQAIELERVLVSRETGVADKEKVKRVRELYEEAATKFGRQVPRLWEDYARFETQQGEIKRASAVRWRAQQQLGT